MLISVIVPTYNRPNELRKCLDSILIQSRLPNEVIIIDNGDDTETKKIFNEREAIFIKNKIVLKYLKNVENSLTLAKNLGIFQSSGDLVSFLDDDLILDTNYYYELAKFFEMVPGAIGVEGLNIFEWQKGGIKDKLLQSYQKIFFLADFTNECKVLPSLRGTYSHKEGIINCEWLSGAATFKKDILVSIRPDTNLKKYCHNEDLDLSYRIFKKYPGTLFMTTAAKYNHGAARIKRMPNKELVYMSQVYDLYLFHKIIDQSFGNKIIFVWSRMGDTALNLIVTISRKEMNNLHYVISAPFYGLIHLKEIIKGNLDFFNKTLS
jgi:glycosyltransferase involved in cell wall biosynthesis